MHFPVYQERHIVINKAQSESITYTVQWKV